MIEDFLIFGQKVINNRIEEKRFYGTRTGTARG
jgi:hypothetical protein